MMVFDDDFHGQSVPLLESENQQDHSSKNDKCTSQNYCFASDCILSETLKESMLHPIKFSSNLFPIHFTCADDTSITISYHMLGGT